MIRKFLLLGSALVSLVSAGCTTTPLNPTSGANWHYVKTEGYAFATDVKCIRVKPKSQFDRECDAPRLGFKGFSADPGFSVGSAGAGGGPG